MPSRNADLNRIADELKSRRPPCFICGQPIDYSLPPDHPDAFSLEHRYPRSTHPHLVTDPANCFAAHLDCNKRRGNRAYKPGLGVRSREW
ncbi:hypothetical protein CH296_00455 [Rhodococcus sp. 14-2496-1d]|uniref:HNH endonuclease n=1 Tax=Rhodococcus sp. 14-2496-1d TaxID=2023146 RepID=UPI000B9BB386|nr:HNH endonuclease [Rhodococcus sp. 14-2496-1d]OZF40762.1 hypothetical protein CH296_00455 [Rhodococcus sp. 14-2496-1d]